MTVKLLRKECRTAWTRRSVAGAMVVVMSLAAVLMNAPSASAAPLPGITMVAFHNSTQSTSTELPVGATFEYLVNYTCATEDCVDYSIDVPFPAGLAIGNPNYGSDIASYSRTGDISTGTTLRFQMVSSIPPGTSGQFSIPASTPSFTTLDNTAFGAAAVMSSTVPASPTSTSATVTVTARADISLRADAEFRTGGVVDDLTRYRAWTCLDGVAPSSVWGPLGTEPNATLVVALPVGAVLVDGGGGGGGGTFAAGAPDTITWTLPARNDPYCSSNDVLVRFPTSDPANTVGALKTFDVAWTAAELGKAPSTYTASVTHTLTAPAPPPSNGQIFSANLSTPRDYGTAPTRKAAVGNSISIGTGAGNVGTTTWTQGIVEVPVPNVLRPSAVTSENRTTATSTVELQTTCGPDRVADTGDDAMWEPAATVAPGANVSWNPDAAWPNSSPSIPTSCHVISVRVSFGGLVPGDGFAPITVSGIVQAVGRDGTTTDEFDQFGSQPTLIATTLGGSQSETRTLTGQIDLPKSTLFVISNGPGTLAPGVVEGDLTLSFGNSGNPLRDPVMTSLLPLNSSMASWSGSGWTGAPTPTKTEIANWAGTGRTLVRWTFPAGTTTPINEGYTVNFRVALNEFAYGNLRAAGRVDSAATSVLCVYDFFGAGVDTDDFDGDGNTTEQTCRWDADINPNPAASASLTSKVKGSFDMAFVAGPAAGQSIPASNDSYQIVVTNNGRIELDNVNLVDKLPRSGDTNILTTGTRNPSTNTFPVFLRGTPTVPTGLTMAPTVYYSIVDDACQPELGYSPSGCNAPNWVDWAVIAPTTLSDVTMIRVDFGANVLKPGFSYTIELPVTTPSTGASEPDFAIVNADPLNQPNESATNSAAFRARRVDNSSSLNSAEPPGVALEMPGALGPIGAVPTPTAIATTGVATVVHTATTAVPTGGSVHLMNGSDPVTTLVVPNVGTYSVDATTGALHFAPVLGYSGVADPVTFWVYDVYGQQGTNTWSATVTLPPAPTAAPLTSTGPVATAQGSTVTVPSGGALKLLSGSAAIDSLVVAGVGTYTVNPSTGAIGFVPLDGFHGTPAAVQYRINDAYGQSADSSYTPTVTLDGLVAAPLYSSGIGTSTQTQALPVPSGGRATLLGENGEPVNLLVFGSQGTHTFDSVTGVVIFTPVLGFHGAATPVSYRITDLYAQTATSTYTPTVITPAPPTAPALSSSSTPEAPSAPQQVAVVVPVGGTITMLEPSGNPATTVVMPGEGTYTLNPSTGAITFTPIDGFDGPVTPIAFRVTDAYGQTATGSYSPAIAPQDVVVAVPPLYGTGTATNHPRATIVIPPGGHVALIDASGNPTDTVAVAGAGTFLLNTATGVIEFVPASGFVGTAYPVTYQVTAADGTTSLGTFTPTVVASEPVRGTPESTLLPVTGSGATSLLVHLGSISLLLGLLLCGRRSQLARAAGTPR